MSGMRPETRSRRFWAQVDKTESCWLWRGEVDKAGYGRFGGGRVAGQKVSRSAHRFAYTEIVGPVPEGLQLDHLCRVRRCVNPSHLEPVTCRENVRRSEAPTAIVARSPHCPRGHEFTPENSVLRGGRRRCRRCENEAKRRRYLANRAAFQEKAREYQRQKARERRAATARA